MTASGPVINSEAIARAVERRRPDLAPLGALRVLSDEGWSSVALESASGLLVLVARQPEHPRWEKVARVLPLLEGRLPLPVPPDLTLLPAGAGVPSPVLAYRKLAGRPPTLEEATGNVSYAITQSVGAFLAELHRIPVETVHAAEVPTSEPWFGAVADHVRNTLPTLHHLLTREEFARIEVWWRTFQVDPRMRAFDPVFRHGDIWFGNILVEGDRVTGIIDWEDAAIGDPALDLANQYDADERYFDLVLESYRAAGGRWSNDHAYRARRWHEAAAFQWVSWGMRTGTRAAMQRAITTVRANPILAGW